DAAYAARCSTSRAKARRRAAPSRRRPPARSPGTRAGSACSGAVAPPACRLRPPPPAPRAEPASSSGCPRRPPPCTPPARAAAPGPARSPRVRRRPPARARRRSARPRTRGRCRSSACPVAHPASLRSPPADELLERLARVRHVPVRFRPPRRGAQERLEMLDRLVLLALVQVQERQTVVRAGRVRVPLQHRAVRLRGVVRHPDPRVRDRDLLEHRRVARRLPQRQPERRQRFVEVPGLKQREPFLVVVYFLFLGAAAEESPEPGHWRASSQAGFHAVSSLPDFPPKIDAARGTRNRPSAPHRHHLRPIPRQHL